MWCLLRPGSFSADTSTPGNFDFEFYQNKLSLTHGSFLVKRELTTVFLINRSIWKVVGTVKCFTIYSCSFKFSSEWVRDSEGRGEWVVMAVSAARPGCVLTCVINSLSHGYKLCYINQVKTTGYISAHWLSRTCPMSRARGMFSSNIYICFPSVTNWHVFASQQTLVTAETVRRTNYPFLNSLCWLAQWACVTSFCPGSKWRREEDSWLY